MTFIEKLHQTILKNDSLVCVGLDPNLDLMPAGVSKDAKGVFDFCKQIIDATATSVCAYKPQVAYFSAIQMESVLIDIIDYIKNTYDIPVLLDAKRGDIGPTALQYARESFEAYKVDAVTLNPYMGTDSISAFYDNYPKKGIVVLCRTSNASASELQDLKLENGDFVYEHIAKLAVEKWNKNNNCLLVMGATYCEQMQRVRQLVKDDIFFLVPGIGAQGGDLQGILKAGLNSKQSGLLISASRSILYASAQADFATKAYEAALELKQEINNYRKEIK